MMGEQGTLPDERVFQGLDQSGEENRTQSDLRLGPSHCSNPQNTRTSLLRCLGSRSDAEILSSLCLKCEACESGSPSRLFMPFVQFFKTVDVKHAALFKNILFILFKSFIHAYVHFDNIHFP